MTRCLCIVAFVAATTTAAFAQFIEPGPDAPRVDWSGQRPLETLADPDTPEVIAGLITTRDRMVRLGGQLEWLASLADAVLVADVTSIDYSLTRLGAPWAQDDSWVTSQVSAAVVEVFKRPEGHTIEAGGTVTWRADGGQVVIRGTRITAVYPDEELLRVGKRYLILGWVRKGELQASGSNAFELTEEGWRSLALGDARRGMDEIEEMNPEDLLRQLRAQFAEQP